MNYEAVGVAVVRMDQAAAMLYELRKRIPYVEEHAADLYHADCWDEVYNDAKIMADELKEAANALSPRSCAVEKKA